MKSTLEYNSTQYRESPTGRDPLIPQETTTADRYSAVETDGAQLAEPRRGRIGRVVAGSLISGLVAAIVLVAGPLAGAQEHVITGSVLVTFAIAWAALFVMSIRLTNQPQRWAIAPAVFMAVSGGGILAFAPTGNALGWVWPPLVIALSIWMARHVRRELRSRTRVWIVYPVLASLMLAAIGGAYETYREHKDVSAFPMPGRLFDVGGHRLHINCTGTGSPTVVLEPGLGEPSTAMAWIAPDVAAHTRVCVYDRAGRAWSESASAPRDGKQTATDLHTLLERAGERGPFVLAGHSAGGIYVLNFAHAYPEQVAGVVLIDSMHPEQYTKVPSWPAFYAMFRRATGVLPSLSRLGLGRLIYRSSYSELPELARNEERAFLSNPRDSRSLRDEFSTLRAAMNQAGSLTSLGARPLVVVTARNDAAEGWAAAQDELALLSTNGLHRTVMNATHATLTENPVDAAQSSQAVIDVVTAVREGIPVADV